MFGRINFGDLVNNWPICQIKIPAKVSGYTVYTPRLGLLHTSLLIHLFEGLVNVVKLLCFFWQLLSNISPDKDSL